MAAGPGARAAGAWARPRPWPFDAIIADLFSKARLPLALAVFSAGVQVAGVVFTPLGALIADRYGWRAAFGVAGVLGVAVAVFFAATVREPRRGASDAAAVPQAPAPGLAETARFLAGSRAYLYLLGGSFLVGTCVNAMFAWNPSFLVRVHGVSIVTVGALFSPVQSFAAMGGTLLGGYLADRLGRSGPIWRMLVPALPVRPRVRS